MFKTFSQLVSALVNSTFAVFALGVAAIVMIGLALNGWFGSEAVETWVGVCLLAKCFELDRRLMRRGK